MNTLTAPQLADTLLACCKSIGVCTEYVKGKEYAPHYPMPVIHYQAEFNPDIPPVLLDVHNGHWLLWSTLRQAWV